ncbi:hypothetical protein [Rhodocaloribacter sp.]
MSTFETRMNTTRRLLREAAGHLEKVRALRDGPEPDYPALLTETLRTVRRSLEGLLTYHGIPFTDETPLRVLVEAAVELASILRTPTDLALTLEATAPAVAGRNPLPIGDREAILNGSYTARDVFTMTLGELPKSFAEDARLGESAPDVLTASP